MAGAAGLFLPSCRLAVEPVASLDPRGRLARAAPHGSPVNENVMDFTYDCRFLLLMQSVCD